MRQIVIESTGNYLGEIVGTVQAADGDTVPVVKGGVEYTVRISTAGTVPETVTFPGEASPVECIVNYGVRLETT